MTCAGPRQDLEEHQRGQPRGPRTPHRLHPQDTVSNLNKPFPPPIGKKLLQTD